MINIEGLSKAEVLKELFNNSKIQGFNAQMVTMGLIPYPKNLTTFEAQEILDNMEEEIYFDYLNGKVMKVDLTSDEGFDPWGYDRDNGEGSAERIIQELRGGK
jgi:hypothetical protein